MPYSAPGNGTPIKPSIPPKAITMGNAMGKTSLSFPWTAASASTSITTLGFGKNKSGWTIKTLSIRRIPSTNLPL
jgi:hypothetical protein